MLWWGPAVPEARELVQARDFYNPPHGHIFEAVSRLDDAGLVVEPIAVQAELGRMGLGDEITAGHLVELQAAAPSPGGLRGWCEQIAEDARKVRQAGLGQEMYTAAMDPTRSADSVVEEFETRLAGEGEGPAVRGTVPAGDAIGLVIERAELAAQRGSSGVVGLATGHRDLDRLLMGLDPGSLGVVGARPSMGKTSFAAGVASWNVLRDVPSLFVSCEMGAVEIGVRLVGQVSDLGSEALKTGRLSPSQWERLRRMKDAFASAPLEIMDAGAPTPAAIRLRARAMQAKRGLGLVVVDYLGLLTPPAKRDRNDLEVGDTAKALKALARDLGCVVVLLSQLNRSCESRADKRPVLSDLRDSGNIEEHADVVMFLYRDEVYNPASPDRGTAEVIVAKNRNGPTGMARLAWLPTVARFGDLAREPVF